MKTSKTAFNRYILSSALLLAVKSFSVLANDWQPISSERLIKLPANVMERALEHDFQNSALASKIKHVDQRLLTNQTDLASLQSAIKQAQGDQLVELRHQFLEQKSTYIDQVAARQAFRRDELKTRIEVYQNLLGELQADARRAQEPVSNAVREQQNAARLRMQTVAARVDESLFETALEPQSRYAREYDANLQKIKQLQLAIGQHALNRNHFDAEEQLTRESFIRELLANAEADLALISQEDEMLGYMARLVAMDAHALQIELTYGSLDGADQSESIAAAKPANMVDFFIP
jgi:hypothetical protein